MADSYISVGQNTAYFYKFDVVDDVTNGLYWHQYMTNLQDPSSQANNLYNTYAKNNILNASINFVIPVYNNMPASCGIPTNVETAPGNAYYINGTGVRLRKSPTTDDAIVAELSQYEVVTMLQENAGTNNGYTWAKVKRSNGDEGYVATEFIQKCN